MFNKKAVFTILALVSLAVGVFILWDIYTYRNHIDAFSGATPQALNKAVPSSYSITVDGLVKQEYKFSSRALNLLAKSRVRMPEISPRGEVKGAYIYYGIPILHILEGVVPQKQEGAAFDRPLDMIVEIHSAPGKKSSFSYGELIVCDDSNPVMLAFSREQVLPSKSPESYTRNEFTHDLESLRLVCPGDDNDARFLDNVERITLTLPSTPDNLLPQTVKGKDCSSHSITCLYGEKQWPLVLDGLPQIEVGNWFRTGHGRGIKGDNTAQATGYPLAELLKQNFPDAGDDDFFLFVACDGYRSLFSARELFLTREGNEALLMTALNGQPTQGGYTIAAIGDFFVDRCVRSVTHILHLPHQ